MAGKYYYAEISFNARVVQAYRGLSKKELDNVLRRYTLIRDYKHKGRVDTRSLHTFVFGPVEDLPKMGEIGECIMRVAKPYHIDHDKYIEVK